MTLDPRLVRAEDAMRSAFAHAVDGNGDAMVAAFGKLSEQEAVLAVDLARQVTIEKLKSAKPTTDGDLTDTDMAGLGADIAEAMSWAKFAPSTVETYLKELRAGESPSTDGPTTVALAIVVGGYMVIGFTPQGQTWSKHLDDLLDKIVPTE